ncbi:hypothetical protein HY605_00005 [Candidatus Peregrinibacteria bacterium]|nr:hypothetical protein [Candidatus Peregrinibacteria bacterium]
MRSSRSFPFASKVTGYNFIEIAMASMLKASTGQVSKAGQKLLEYKDYKTLDLDHVGVKAPQFSFPRLKGADPVLGVEMASTGEVACFGEDLYEALLKSMISVGFALPKKGILFSVGGVESKADILPAARAFEGLGFKIYGTEGSSAFLKENGIKCQMVHKMSAKKSPSIVDVMMEGAVDLIVNIPTNYSRSSVTDGYLIRRKSVDLNIPLITNVQIAKIVAEALKRYSVDDLKIKDMESYFK